MPSLIKLGIGPIIFPYDWEYVLFIFIENYCHIVHCFTEICISLHNILET